jgi:hypothetical protein
MHKAYLQIRNYKSMKIHTFHQDRHTFHQDRQTFHQDFTHISTRYTHFTKTDTHFTKTYTHFTKSLNLLEPSRPPQACRETAVPLVFQDIFSKVS